MWWVSMFCIYVNRWLDLERSPLAHLGEHPGAGMWHGVCFRWNNLAAQRSWVTSGFQWHKELRLVLVKSLLFLSMSRNISGRAKYKAGVSLSGRSHGTVVRRGKTKNKMRCIFIKMNPFTLFIQKHWLYFPLHCMIQNQIHILWPVYSDTIHPPWVVTTLTYCLKSPVSWTSPQR